MPGGDPWAKQQPCLYQTKNRSITGSVVHNVLTRTERMRASQGKRIDCVALVRRVLGLVHFSEDIPALKYGQVTEPEARAMYEEKIMGNDHRNLTVQACGLIVKCEKVYMYVGDSPDGFVMCECGSCGRRVLEIKCPLT